MHLTYGSNNVGQRNYIPNSILDITIAVAVAVAVLKTICS
jgi:hypothetical protein